MNAHTNIRALAALASFAAIWSAAAQTSYRIYDLRDLDALAPAPPSVPAPPPPPAPPRPFGLGASEPVAASGAAPDSAPQPEEQMAFSDHLLSCLHQGLLSLGGAEYSTVAAGVFLVEAEEEAHTKLTALLEQVRALFGERYLVELTGSIVPAAEAPAPGQPAKEPLFSDVRRYWRQQVVVARRTPTAVEAVREHTYVSSLDPALAEGVVGYEPVIGTATEGVRMRITVGAGAESAADTTLNLDGQLTAVDLSHEAGPHGAAQSAGWMVQLPVVIRRTVRTAVRISFDQPTVVAVSGGFERDEVIVITAALKKLAE